ncbi:SpoIIE family protein phosphatase [Kineococcus vitellinus]|uniref:SpoIIE family protein phosphatase n=1 Tax=Kineococcus vitellinus TaxID=2696565 RepID=UPI001412A71F
MAPQQAERARLLALRDYVDVSAPPPHELQAVVRLATRLTGLSNAVVNIIDEHLQRQLASEGFDRADCAREDSMCTYSVAVRGAVHTTDARRDVRFAANPWVDGRMGRVRAYAAAPLLTPDGHALGTLCVFDPETGELDEAQRADLADLAGLVVAIFDRERRARRDTAREEQLHRARQAADLARSLQQALLPHRLPQTEAVRLVSRYLPGTHGADVGGDFFDAVVTDRATVLVMGDVQGHNSSAAALMGRVRTAVRAYVSEGHEPAAVLERTNRLMQSFDGELFATCCLLALDEGTGELVLAVRPLHDPVGVQQQPRGEDEDGGDVGEDALERTLLQHAGAPADVVADAVLDPARRQGSDDAALLVVDYAGPLPGTRETRLQLPSDARAVRAAREHLRDTLGAWDLDETVDAAELVVSELVTNALVHTGCPAALTLRHEVGESLLCVGVEDLSTQHPRPRESGEEATGGRGMHIVELIAQRWWVAPRGDGKTVWADLLVG